MATIAEIREELVEKYAYKKSDFEDKDGKKLNFKQVEALLKKEKQNEKKLSEISHLSDFDGEVIEASSTKFKDDDLITVMAGINGRLKHISPVGNGRYVFNGFGQKQKMPYKELKAINNLVHETLSEGLIIILNPDIIKEFGLEERYKSFLTQSKIDEILSMDPNSIRDVIKTLPKAMKTTLIDVAKSRYNSGKLDSIGVITVFEDVYDISFDDNIAKSDFIIK